MILDLDKFLATERPHWESLERGLEALERGERLDLEATRRFWADYERASSALARVSTYAAEPAVRGHLERLVARAYAELHSLPSGAPRRFAWALFLGWFLGEFPRALRRHMAAFRVSVGATLLGVLFGGLSLVLDPESRSVTMAFGHDRRTPSQRVAEEEASGGVRPGTSGTSFAAYLMQNNIRVSILALALGMTFGVGTLVVLFHNGVILGAIAMDYIQDGQGAFLAGWILPHGSIELPAIMIAGQAGLVLGHALLGGSSRDPLHDRLRALGPDLLTLLGGVAVMLVWAGVVEGTFSQWHAPVLPYGVKVVFGVVELAGLVAFLSLAGRRPAEGSDSVR